MASALRWKIREWAILSRLFLFTMQVIFNTCIPDHNADAFYTPINEDTNFLDWLSSFVFGGLSNWDGQHFIHISKFGYTYENNLAFFPLYPIIMKLLANTVGIPLQCFLSYHNVILICGVIVNFVCFVLSAEVLYELSRIVLRDELLAYRAALLYCINPASIFFSAVYTESLFALTTFTGMFFYQKNQICLSVLAFAFSGATRSNAIVHCGFPLYFVFSQFVYNIVIMKMQKNFLPNFIVLFIISTFKAVFYISIISIPIIAHQIYAFTIYCIKKQIDYPVEVTEHANQNGLKMPSIEWTPTWCDNPLPLSYSAVQEKYWDVGFLKYYQWKQVPNFMLALPITTAILYETIRYCVSNPTTCFQLGFEINPQTEKKSKLFGINSPLIFPYIIHCTTILIFGLLFINVQVLTRMICASSPVLYWFAASQTSPNSKLIPIDILSPSEVRQKLETNFNLTRWGDNIVLDQIQYWQHKTTTSYLYFVFFLSYFIFGMAMFVNTFPFT